MESSRCASESVPPYNTQKDEAMQSVTPTSRTLEFAPPCKQLSLIQIVVSLLSFSFTWYRVWWDSIIGLFVASWGYYTLRDTNGQNLNVDHVRYFHNLSIASMVSHVVAVSVVLYYMLQGHVLNDVIGWESVHVKTPGWVFLGFLITMLVIMISLTAFTIWRSHSLLAEIARNSVVSDLTRGSRHA